MSLNNNRIIAPSQSTAIPKIKTKTKVNEIDLQISYKFNTLKKIRGKSLTDIARLTNLSSQQVLKYSSGINRMSASFIAKLSNIFNISPVYFYENILDNKLFSNNCSWLDENQQLLADYQKLNTQDKYLIQHVIKIALKST